VSSFGPLPPPPPDDGSRALDPAGHEIAGAWPRIGARLIDSVILVTVSFVLAAVFIDLDGVATGTNTGFLVMSLALGAAYSVGFVGTLGATPGKLVLGLRVVRQEDGTSPPGWDKALLRYAPDLAGLVPVIGGLVSIAFLILSLVWLGTDPRRRTIYDRAATTYVVRA
jgi:uncharacterized RDD family membrane protein YckC